MKTILLSLLLAIAVLLPDSHAQTLKQLERKAKKAWSKEAYGMALYHSQALLKLDNKHPKALNWAGQASEKLGISNTFPFVARPITVGPALPSIISKPSSKLETLSLVVTTFHALDSNALHGTYIGITNDGFGEGDFSQNGLAENTAVFQVPVDGFYTITATKPQYAPSMTTLSADLLERPDTVRLRLYLTPTWGGDIRLCFDHGKPTGAKSADALATSNYGDLWLEYLYRINEYIDSNTVADSPTDKAQAQTQVGRFFANDVDANFHRLEQFCEFLENHLQSTSKITVALEAGLSPAENGPGGQTLLDRRLQSVEGYFDAYKNGLFRPFLAHQQLVLLRRYAAKTEVAHQQLGHPVFGIDAAKARTVTVRLLGF